MTTPPATKADKTTTTVEQAEDTTTTVADDGTITVTAVDFNYEGLPDTVPAGTKFKLVNDSEEELHEFVAFRLPDDESARPMSSSPSRRPSSRPCSAARRPPCCSPSRADRRSMRSATAPSPSPAATWWPARSPWAPTPTSSSSPRARRPAGGRPHFHKGMYAELTVEYRPALTPDRPPPSRPAPAAAAVRVRPLHAPRRKPLRAASRSQANPARPDQQAHPPRQEPEDPMNQELPIRFCEPEQVAPDTWVVRQLAGEGMGPVATFVNSSVITGAEPVIVDCGPAVTRDEWLETDVLHRRPGRRPVDLPLPRRRRPHRQPAPGARRLPERHARHHRLHGRADERRVRHGAAAAPHALGERRRVASTPATASCVAVRPPTFDSPTTRGLFDTTYGRLLGLRCHGLARDPRGPRHRRARPGFWREGFLGQQLMLSPWLNWAAPERYDPAVDRVRSLGAWSSPRPTARPCTARRSSRPAACCASCRYLPPAKLPGQMDLDAIVSMLVAAAAPRRGRSPASPRRWRHEPHRSRPQAPRHPAGAGAPRSRWCCRSPWRSRPERSAGARARAGHRSCRCSWS